MKYKLLPIFLTLLTAQLFAQDKNLNKQKSNQILFGPSLGYQYQGENFIKLSAFSLMGVNDDQYLKVNLGANFTRINKKTAAIPELGISYYLSENVITPYTKLELTTQTITPTAGISYFTFVDVGVGYGVNFGNADRFKTIKGFTLAVGINVPLNFNVY